MADVQNVSTHEVYNVNPQKLEKFLHKFFSNVCLDINIIDNHSKPYSPREWFIAPLDIIEKAIELIINGSIIDFKYDSSTEMIIPK